MNKRVLTLLLTFCLLFAGLGREKSYRASLKFSVVDSTRKQRIKYLRPYIAVWIEDSSGRRVKDLALWYKKGKSKYLRRLKAWSKKGGLDDYKKKNIPAAVTGATKRAGSYSLTWDGLDMNKKKCPPGQYTIKIESCREKAPNAKNPDLAEVSFTWPLVKTAQGQNTPEIQKIELKSKR
jgi:hypothetical protein